MVEEEYGILTYNGRMFSLPHFHFQSKSVNISTILASKLKICVYIQTYRIISWLLLPPSTKLEQGNIFRSVCQEFCPWGGVCPDTPWSRHPQGQESPWEQCMLGDTGNKRVVSILLECMLVWNIFLEWNLA